MIISAGIAIYYNNKILLIHPSKTKLTGTWSVPKGKVEDGESLLETAIRETKEEVGINIHKDIISDKPRLFNYTSRNGHVFKKSYIFTANIISLDEIGLDSEMILMSNLQTSEVDMALFFDKYHAKDYIFWRYRPLLSKI